MSRIERLRARVPDPIASAPDIEKKRDVARSLVATAAEAARQRFMTPGDLKATVYRQKQIEAAAWQAAVDDPGATPAPADYPFLQARALRLNEGAPDYQAVADEWNAKAAAWLVMGATIEDLYDTALAAIASATNESEVRAALKIAWPNPA